MNIFPVFGIHIGNSSVCMALCRIDEPTLKLNVEVMTNNAGERVMPALVTITENEPVVGTACKSLLATRWNTTITCNKRLMNMDSPEATNGERRVATSMLDDEVCYELPLDGRIERRTPTTIAMDIFQILFEIAETVAQGYVIEMKCVIMVPRYFTGEAQFRYHTAAVSTGWEVLQIMNESPSPILAYNLLKDKDPPPPQIVLMFRVGGKTCECTVMELQFGLITTLEYMFCDGVGGKLIIHSLTQYLADEFYRRHRLDPRESHRSLTKLTMAAEQCLCMLSTLESATCFVESLYEGVDFSLTISRGRFESLLYPFLTVFERPIRTILSRLDMTPDDVDKVLLCGGLMKIPRLKKYICDIFKHSPSTEVVPLPNGINYDEVLACGAAYQAGHITMDRFKTHFPSRDINVPILDGPLIVKVCGAVCEPVKFENGLPLPATKTMVIESPDSLVVFEFHHQTSTGEWLFGMVNWKDLEDRAEMTCEIDCDSSILLGLVEGPGLYTYKGVELYSSQP